MIGKLRRTGMSIVLTVVTAGLFLAGSSNAETILKKLRIGEENGRSRLTMMLDGPIDYSEERLGSELRITLRDTRLLIDPAMTSHVMKSGYIKKIQVLQIGANTVVATITLREQAQHRTVRRDGSSVFFGALFVEASANPPVVTRQPSAPAPGLKKAPAPVKPTPPRAYVPFGSSRRIAQTTGLDLPAHVSRQVSEDAARILLQPSPERVQESSATKQDPFFKSKDVFLTLGIALFAGLSGTWVLMFFAFRRRSGKPTSEEGIEGNVRMPRQVEDVSRPGSIGAFHQESRSTGEDASVKTDFARAQSSPFNFGKSLNIGLAGAGPASRSGGERRAAKDALPEGLMDDSGAGSSSRARVARELGVGTGELDLAVTLRKIQEAQVKGDTP